MAKSTKLGLLRSFSVVATLAVAACGGQIAPTDPGPPSPSPAPKNDAPAPNPEPPLDHGQPSAVYPAFVPDVAKLQNRGGKVLTNPVIVSVTWADDPNGATFESLVDTIGSTRYWREIVGEYGVGAATSGAKNHVRLTKPLLAKPTDDPEMALQDLLVSSISDPQTSGWPAPTDQTIYTLFVSGSAAETICNDGAGGFHDSLRINGKDVAFAVVLECDGGPKMPALQSATISASHELAEAAVDPFPDASPGWQGLDDDHLAWELMQMGQDENGDMCEFYDDSYGPYAAPELPFFVQRQWSNASAAAGHSPCVPAPPKEAYFNVAALANDVVVADFAKLDLPPFNPKSRGIRLRVGETRRVALGFYSDAPTAPFHLDAFEADPFDPTSFSMDPARKQTLELSLDKNVGQNGEKAYLTIRSKEATQSKVALVILMTTLEGKRHFMPLLVGGRDDEGGGTKKSLLRRSRFTPRVGTRLTSLGR